MPNLLLSRFSSLTSDEVLLGHTVDAGQVAVVLPAVLLCILPGVPAGEVSVAVAMKLPPRVFAALSVCRGVKGIVEEKERRGEVIEKDGY